MIAGIDGIHLTSPDFSVKDISKLKNTGWRQSGSHDIGEEPKVLIRDLSGNDIRAPKIYNNKCDIANYDISPFGLLIHFNPSKTLHPYHLISTGSDLNYIVKTVQKEVQSIGIDVNIDSMKLSRLDIAKQATMKYDISQYAAAFKLLHAKRASKKEYPSGYYFANKSRECVFYDKALEAKIDEVNFMRCEVKYKDTKTTQRATQIVSLSQLKGTLNEEINGFYSKHITDNVFCRKKIGFQSVLDFSSEVQIMKSFIEINKRGAWMQYLAMHNIDEVLNGFGSIDKFVDCWEKAGYKRRQLFTMKSEIKRMINTKSFLDSRRKKVTATALLEEVYQKFA